MTAPRSSDFPQEAETELARREDTLADTKSADKAGPDYWERVWKDMTEVPVYSDPTKRGLNNHVYFKFHEFFSALFQGQDCRDKRLVEIGCARSIWLPYFSKNFGFKVAGLDYSETGCRQAREILRKTNTEGSVSCCDFFSPDPSLLESFDVVVSFGVAEHFQPTSECIKAFARMLRPGGRLITVIPNLTGLIGFLQRFADRDCFAAHVPLTLEDLKAAHEDSGMPAVFGFYCIFGNFWVVNISSWRKTRPFAYRWVCRVVMAVSRLAWILDRLMPGIGANRVLSSYVVCEARKKCG